MVHIGSLIKEEVERQKLPKSEFAKQVNCTRRTVYDIFARSSIDTELLKHISKVLNRNFFKDLASDPDLAGIEDDGKESREKAVAQFYNTVPKLLRQMGKNCEIVFGGESEEEPFLPDLGLTNYFITFTIGSNLSSRIKDNPLVPVEKVRSGKNGAEIEVCRSKIFGSVLINIILDYKTEEEWRNTLDFAFETYARYENGNNIILSNSRI